MPSANSISHRIAITAFLNPPAEHRRRCPAPLTQGLNERCRHELEVIGEQFPFEPLKFLPKSLRLTFAEGIQMLQEAGYDVSVAAAGCSPPGPPAACRPRALWASVPSLGRPAMEREGSPMLRMPGGNGIPP